MSFCIDHDACIVCCACIVNCPVKCIELALDGKICINNNECIHCGKCEYICPQYAIEENFDYDEDEDEVIEPLNDIIYLTYKDIENLYEDVINKKVNYKVALATIEESLKNDYLLALDCFDHFSFDIAFWLITDYVTISNVIKYHNEPNLFISLRERLYSFGNSQCRAFIKVLMEELTIGF